MINYIKNLYIKYVDKKIQPTQFDNPTQYDFSIVIPTRLRYSLVIRCLESIRLKSANLDNIEVILISDNDDEFTDYLIYDYIYQNPNVHIKYLKRERSSYINRDYYQYGFQQSSGKYLWTMGNDCEIITDNWDTKAKESIEDFLLDKPDRLCYIFIGDDLNLDRSKQWTSCCFPIFTREVLEALGCTMPIEIESYGADYWGWQNFKKCGYNRILDIRDMVELKHYAPYTGRSNKDLLTERLYVPKKCALDETEERKYIELIKEHIRNKQNESNSNTQ